MAEILNSTGWLLILIVWALAWIYCTHKIMEFGYRIIAAVVNKLCGLKEIKDNLQQ